MNVLLLTLIGILLPTPIQPAQDFVDKRIAELATSRTVRARFKRLFETTYTDTVHRERDAGYMRYTYEGTPHFEMGFVFGEIIERYRRMADLYKKMTSFTFNAMYDQLDALEYLQKMYFEIFHLVAMMHEIPQKYKGDERFNDLTMTEEEKEALIQAQKAFLAAAEKAAQAAKKAAKKAKKEKEKAAAGIKPEKNPVGGDDGLKELMYFNASDPKTAGQGVGPQSHHAAFKQLFPLDYGWEVGSIDV